MLTRSRALVCVVVVLGLVGLGISSTAAAADPLPPATCDMGGGARVTGLGSTVRKVRLWVPSGGRVEVFAEGKMAPPGWYWGAFRSAYNLHAVFEEANVDSFGHLDQFSFTEVHEFPFSVFLDWGPAFTNNGPSAYFTVALSGVVDFAGNGISWDSTLRIIGGDGSIGPDCAAVADGLGAPRGTSAEMGDPVDTFTGNLFVTNSDLEDVGGAAGLSVVRSYNSTDPRTTSLGRGWRTQFDSTAVESGGGSATVTLHDGHRLVFPAGPGGSFGRPGGETATLVRDADGSLRMRYADGSQILFDTSGRVEGLTDANGPSLSVVRNASGLILSVVSSLGGSLTFQYAGQLLSGVTGSDGRSVSYGYTNGRLTTYVDAAGKATSYAYDGNGYLTTVTDPTNVPLVSSTFNHWGQVVAQTSPHGGAETYAYDRAALTTTQTVVATGEQVIYTHSPEGDVLSVRDPFGKSDLRTAGPNRFLGSRTDRSGVSSSVGRDARGNVTSLVSPATGTSTFGFDGSDRPTSIALPGAGTTTLSYAGSGSTRLASSITDAAGKTTTRSISNGLVMSETDPDGVITTYTYTAKRQLASRTIAGSTTTFEYWPQGWLRKITTPEGRVTSFTYDADGRRLTTTSPSGHLSATTYDDAGRPLTQTDTTGAVTTYSYNGQGLLVTVAPPGRPASSLAYNALGELTKVTDPTGVAVEVGYGPLGRVLWSKDQAGRQTTYSYRNDGQLWKTVAPDGGVVENIYDSAGRLWKVKDAVGRETSYGYDAAGRVSSVTDPAGGVTAVTFDAVGRVVTRKDATNKVTTIAYTAAGRVKTVTDPAGVVTTYVYDAAGRLWKTSNPVGNTSETLYTADGNVWKERSPSGLETVYAYGPNGEITSVTDPAGVVTTNTWSARGELLSTKRAGRGAATYSYRADGNLASSKDALGATTAYSYDAGGRLTGRVTPAGTESWTFASGEVTSYTAPSTGGTARTWTYSYDTAGRPRSVTDPTGRVTTNTYNAAGELVNRSSAGGGATTVGFSYTYDGAGRAIAIAAPDGTYSRTYDTAGRLTAVTPPDGRYVQHQYDSGGRSQVTTTPEGLELVYSYDAAGRLAKVSPNSTLTDWFNGDDNASVDPAKWTRQVSGGATATLATNRLKLATTSSAGSSIGITSTAPSAANVVATVTFDATSASSSNKSIFSVALRQTASGDGYRVDYPSDGTTASLVKRLGGTDTVLGTFSLPTAGSEIRTQVEASGTTIRAKAWPVAGSVPTTWGLSVTDSSITAAGKVQLRSARVAGTNDVAIDGYRQRNNPTTALAPYVSNTYNTDGRLTNESFQGGNSRSYTYTSGRLTTMSQNINGTTTATAVGYDTAGDISTVTSAGVTRNYAYDAASQLLSDSGAGVTRSWTYDTAGRRTSFNNNGTSTNYSYNNASQLVSSTTGGQTTGYTYDAAGRRTAETTGTSQTSWTYDAAGRPITVEATSAGSTVTKQSRNFSPEGLLRRTTITGPGGAFVRYLKYDWDLTAPGGVPQPVSTLDGATNYGLVRNHGRWAATTQGGTPTTAANDVFGSVVNGAGQPLADATSWDPFGNPIGATAHNKTVLGYRGELSTLGETHLRARQYQARTGTFLTLDPLDDVPGTTTSGNRYHYTNNNPLNLTDPTGLRADDNAVVGCKRGSWIPGADALCRHSGATITILTTVFTIAATIALAPVFPATIAVLAAAQAGVAVANAYSACKTGWSLDCGVSGTSAVLAVAGGAFGWNQATGALGNPLDDLATNSGPDFVAGPIGSEPPVPVSQSRMAAGLEDAGLPSSPTRAPGTEYTLPDGSKVRLMEPSGQAPRRASFTNANGQPINPFTGKPVQPPAPPGMSVKDWVRLLTHVEQTP